MEKKARDADSSKGESSIAVNGFLLCKGRLQYMVICECSNLVFSTEHSAATSECRV